MHHIWLKAREFILGHGGAVKVNVFTRFTLALFGQIPWRTTPCHANCDHALAEMVLFFISRRYLTGLGP